MHIKIELTNYLYKMTVKLLKIKKNYVNKHSNSMINQTNPIFFNNKYNTNNIINKSYDKFEKKLNKSEKELYNEIQVE